MQTFNPIEPAYKDKAITEKLRGSSLDRFVFSQSEEGEIEFNQLQFTTRFDRNSGWADKSQTISYIKIYSRLSLCQI